MNSIPTLLGYVASVTGSTVSVHLEESVASGLAIIDGTTYRVGQVGSFVRIPLGYQDLYGIVSEVGVNAAPEAIRAPSLDGTGWMRIQLVGESIGDSFERGISQNPNVNDSVHIVTEKDLVRIYGRTGLGQVVVGRLSSAENIKVRVDLDKLITRHCAVVGSTGSGKSTTVASLLRAITTSTSDEEDIYPNARIFMLDIHGEYANALSDVSSVFRISPNKGEKELLIPYWALDSVDLIGFLTGGVSDDKALHFYDKITELKLETLKNGAYPGITPESLTVDSPIPYSLKRLWYELIEPELRTYEGPQRDQPALEADGDAETLTPPKYKPHAMGNQGPFINSAAPGLKRQLGTFKSRLLDRQYDFLLHPGDWEPDLDGISEKDLEQILAEWLGHDKPITILDLSGVPSTVLTRLIGSILKVIYEAMFWSREKSEGAVARPLLLVMEEAHRYLLGEKNNTAQDIVQRIVKEGRKYGMGAMIISQRPSEVDETILSQCGTFVAMRLSNQADRGKVQGTLPDNLASLMDMLPVLRTGEAIITGEAARIPIRCRISLPPEGCYPDSRDPEVTTMWSLSRRQEDYARVAASWRAQSTRAKVVETDIHRDIIENGDDGEE
jgi:DNA helicase HerA-like ATPase